MSLEPEEGGQEKRRKLRESDTVESAALGSLIKNTD